MNSKLEQSELITEAVKEQLGIEEDDYYELEGDYVDQIKTKFSELDKIRFKMKEFENELKEKDNYIQRLEKLLLDEINRMDLLEEKIHDLKKK